MDNYGYDSSGVSKEPYKMTFTELTECFICKDVQLLDSNPLRNFCDCKTLLAHHVCLSKWIQRGHDSCGVCRAEYQLQRSCPWRSVTRQIWLMLVTALVLLGLVAYLVYYLMTTFDPSPPEFKVAAGGFGLLTVVLVIMCLSHYVSSRYKQARQSSFTVQARRGPEDGRLDRGPWDRRVAVAASPTTGHALSAAPLVQVEGRKQDADKSGQRLSFLLTL